MGPPRMSETQKDSGNQTDAPPECTFAEFFESKPANLIFRITDVTPRAARTGPSSVPMMVPPYATFKAPPIRLWCNSDQCDGIRTFDPGHNDETLRVSESDAKLNARFVSFSCRNCRHAWRYYAILYGYSSNRKKIDITKVGEHPPLSLQVPTRLRKLVGTDQEKFNKGLRSEALGLGVGAFSYYRQVVEDQKDRLLDEIIKVAKLKKASPKLLSELENAKRQNQFSTAVETVKRAIPQVLLVDNHNPLTLLHKALSKGLHAGSDGECLQAAHAIRLVLAEFSDNLAIVLKDSQELREAISNLDKQTNK